jgi:hypothetical protein
MTHKSVENLRYNDVFPAIFTVSEHTNALVTITHRMPISRVRARDIIPVCMPNAN